MAREYRIINIAVRDGFRPVGAMLSQPSGLWAVHLAAEAGGVSLHGEYCLTYIPAGLKVPHAPDDGFNLLQLADALDKALGEFPLIDGKPETETVMRIKELRDQHKEFTP